MSRVSSEIFHLVRIWMEEARCSLHSPPCNPQQRTSFLLPVLENPRPPLHVVIILELRNQFTKILLTTGRVPGPRQPAFIRLETNIFCHEMWGNEGDVCVPRPLLPIMICRPRTKECITVLCCYEIWDYMGRWGAMGQCWKKMGEVVDYKQKNRSKFLSEYQQNIPSRKKSMNEFWNSDLKLALRSSVLKACFFHIHALRHIRASLTTEASKTIAAAIVGSRLDFCNSLLTGTSVSNLTRLQLVQNTLAWVVAKKPRFCRITPVLSDLHWLPVRHRISFKIATIAFRVLQFQQPSYLASLIPKYVPTQALRSSSSLSICVPPRKTTMASSKLFSSVASNIWNALPNHIPSIPALPAFRRALKHHLFLLAYPDSGAKSGKIKPAQCIMLSDAAPTTAIAQLGNTMPPS